MTPHSVVSPWVLPGELVALYACWPVAAWALWRSRDTLRAAAREVPAATWRALALIVLCHALLVWLVVPSGPIEPNNHGYDRWLTVRDAGWFTPWDGEPKHGAGWFALVRPVWLLSGGLISPFLQNTLWMMTGLVAMGAAIRLATRDDALAVLSVAVLAFAPIELHSGPTVSMFVAGQAMILLGWLAAELHVRDRAAASLALAAIATVVSMQTHLEMLGVAPLGVGAWLIAREPKWAIWLWRRPSWWAVIALSVAAVLPHLASLAAMPRDMLLGELGDVEREALVKRVVLQAALVGGAAALARTSALELLDRAPPARRAVAALTLLACGAAVALAAAPSITLLTTPYQGAHLLRAVSETQRALHGFFDPNHSWPAWPPIAAIGALWLIGRHPAWAAALAVWSAAMAVIYGAKWDCWSTVVRGGLIQLPAFAIAAGAGLTLAYRSLRAWLPAPAAVPVIGSLVIASLVPYLPSLRYGWPFVQEHRLLATAHALWARGETVHTLSHLDTAGIPGADRFDVHYFRHYAPMTVGRFSEPAPGLDALLALPPAEAVGRHVALPLSCYRAMFSKLERGWGRGKAVWLDGRVYAAQPGSVLPVGESDLDPFTSLLPSGLTPCWADRDAAVCVEPNPAAPEGCHTWDCPPEARPSPADRPYLDPLCREVRRRFTLEPVAEERVNRGATGTALTDVLDPDAVIGVYRIVGER
jgi:hypothetical protein